LPLTAERRMEKPEKLETSSENNGAGQTRGPLAAPWAGRATAL